MVIQQNKFLTFVLGEENYGIHILKVKEIIGIMPITHVPKMPEYVKGVVNLRGKIIPIMDMRLKFGLEEREYDERTCIIVVEIMFNSVGRLSGFIVDAVSEVLDIPQENIEEHLDYGGVVEEEFLSGLGKVKDKVIMLLNADNIMNEKEKTELGLIE